MRFRVRVRVEVQGQGRGPGFRFRFRVRVEVRVDHRPPVGLGLPRAALARYHYALVARALPHGSVRLKYVASSES